jgi:phosphotransferase system IIA component
VHLGLDTVQLGGAGFTLHVAEGDTVQAGDAVVSWDPAQVEAGGRSPICPVVALQGDPAVVTGLASVGSTVTAGDPLLEWS